jgi:hypothetical protein
VEVQLKTPFQKPLISHLFANLRMAKFCSSKFSRTIQSVSHLSCLSAIRMTSRAAVGVECMLSVMLIQARRCRSAVFRFTLICDAFFHHSNAAGQDGSHHRSVSPVQNLWFQSSCPSTGHIHINIKTKKIVSRVNLKQKVSGQNRRSHISETEI